MQAVKAIAAKQQEILQAFREFTPEEDLTDIRFNIVRTLKSG